MEKQTLSDKQDVGTTLFGEPSMVYQEEDVKEFIEDQKEGYNDLRKDIFDLLIIHKITNVEFMRQLRLLLKAQEKEIIDKLAGPKLTGEGEA